MRAARLLLGALGCAVIGHALLGAGTTPDILPGRHLTFLLTVLALHDAVLLPAVLLVGALAYRFLHRRSRAIVQAALIASLALTLVTLPLALGYGRLADNPSALPRDYRLGLALVLGGIWLAAAVALLATHLSAPGAARRLSRGNRRPDP
jgi:hypothetical protein